MLYNPPSHRAIATQNKLAYLGFHFLNHQHYSWYLAPSENHLLLGLKKQWKFHHFSSDAKATAAAETCLDEQIPIFLSGFQKLDQRARRCIELREE